MIRTSGWINGENQIYENLINEALFRTRCAIPCIVQSFDKNKCTVEAQPAIRERIIMEDGSVKYIQLPLLINVPVAFPCSSSFSVRFPLKKNDECLVIFSDLSIDNFWEKGSIQNPVEVRRHDLSDGIAIPCKLSIPNMKEVSDRLEISCGNNSISMNESDVYVKVGSEERSFSQIFQYIFNHYHEKDGGNTSGPML